MVPASCMGRFRTNLPCTCRQDVCMYNKSSGGDSQVLCTLAHRHSSLFGGHGGGASDRHTLNLVEVNTMHPATRTPQMSWTPGVHAYLHLEDTYAVPQGDEICPERAKWERACARINEGRRHGLYRGASNIDSHGGCYGRVLLYSRRTCCWRNHVEVYNQLPFHFITARALAHHFHLLHYKETINWASCWPG